MSVRSLASGAFSINDIHYPIRVEMDTAQFALIPFVYLRTGRLKAAAGREEHRWLPGGWGSYRPGDPLDFDMDCPDVRVVALPPEVLVRAAATLDGDGGPLRFTGWAPVSAFRFRLWHETVELAYRQLAAQDSALEELLVRERMLDLPAAAALAAFPNSTMAHVYEPGPGRGDGEGEGGGGERAQRGDLVHDDDVTRRLARWRRPLCQVAQPTPLHPRRPWAGPPGAGVPGTAHYSPVQSTGSLPSPESRCHIAARHAGTGGDHGTTGRGEWVGQGAVLTHPVMPSLTSPWGWRWRTSAVLVVWIRSSVEDLWSRGRAIRPRRSSTNGRACGHAGGYWVTGRAVWWRRSSGWRPAGRRGPGGARAGGRAGGRTGWSP
ncbi:hypothetical protein ACIRBX_22250 [Kitasatospora sp. NPDC096147]|uniref:hypothetical protein n=1 Tax=Kitasatospora sp. NPDC096147 TaxID=3364093 RepID=UPI0038047319